MIFIHLVPLNNQIRCCYCGITKVCIDRLKEEIANNEADFRRMINIKPVRVTPCVQMVKIGVK